MRSLYEINNDYLKALDNAFVMDEDTGEIFLQDEMLDQLADEFSDKVDNIVCYIKDLENLNDGIKAEKKALDERFKANEGRVENLKKYVSNALKIRNMAKYETPKCKLSFRTSKSVEVVDENSIDSNYWKEEVVKKLDKKTILDELKNGVEVNGCKLLVKNNLQIK
ncbi:MAG: siphovirus Gp157 family protein [Erysipelotrichia bacterium]|nr:siphovirus Gp157 family protein [Erysipelotrichia bacterium]